MKLSTKSRLARSSSQLANIAARWVNKLNAFKTTSKYSLFLARTLFGDRGHDWERSASNGAFDLSGQCGH